MTEYVWMCGESGYEHNTIYHLFVDQDLAMQWLRNKREKEIKDTLEHRNWTIEDAKEKLKKETRPNMIEYYKDRVENPDEMTVGDIRPSHRENEFFFSHAICSGDTSYIRKVPISTSIDDKGMYVY